MVLLLPREAQEIDPRLTGDAYGMKVSRLVFASLVTIDPHSLEPVPDLAQSVEVITSIHYRAKLRSGLKFSDGSALDATDVAATFRSLNDPLIGSRYATTYRRIKRIETPDSLTVDFHLSGPHATFMTDLELPVLRSEDEHRPVGAMGGPQPIGAGPYVIAARSASRIELRANPFWHRGRPLFPAVTTLVIHDDNTRALRMVAGAADISLNAIPPLLVPLFENKAGFSIKTAPGIGTTYLGINMDSKSLADRRVRQAIAYAIDRRAIVRAKLGGRARLARSWIAPGHWAYSEKTPVYQYDPARSRKLLDEAGVGTGKRDGAPRLELTLRTGSDRFRLSVARVIAEMVRQVGIKVDIRPTEVATLLSDLNRGRFELTILQVPELIEPHLLSWFFASDRIPQGERSEGANRWRLRSSELDAALEAGRVTPDRTERFRAYERAQRILAEQLPVIPLWHEDNVAVTSVRAKAFTAPRDGRFSTLAAP